MTSNQHQRRLSAIVAADIASYSALMGADEAGTVEALKGHQAVVLPLITQHSGRLIDTAGDGILAEFASVLNAVQCAIEIQKVMAGRNVGVPEERMMQFRIGINLGDMIYDDAKVYGDGVNIAARLESLADPGGIVISGKVKEEIAGKLQVTLVDLGAQQLKNIASLVTAFKIKTDDPSSAMPSRPALTLPDKPSIAVLPFSNMSGDGEHEYFSDGITEDIITELSRFSELFVIARNSSFTYKNKAVDVRQVGRELGVRYVLEGSIRKSGDRVRITAQLVEAASGSHCWAERFDRKLQDVFEVQDEVGRSIVGLLAAHVNKAEIARTLTKPPATWKAHDYFLQASDKYLSFLSSFDAELLATVRSLLHQSLQADPSYAPVFALLSNTYIIAYHQPIDADYLKVATLDRAYELALNSVQLDPNLPFTHAKLGNCLTYKGDIERAIACFEKAIALNPNFADWRLIIPLIYSGQLERAMAFGDQYIRHDPFFPPLVSHWRGFCHYLLRQYPEAIDRARDGTERSPNARFGQSVLAAAYARMGDMENARKHVAQVLRIEPSYTISGTTLRFTLLRNKDQLAHFVEGLRLAGLPE